MYYIITEVGGKVSKILKGPNPVVVLHRNHFLCVTSLSISQYHFSIFIYFTFASTKLQVILKSRIKL